MELQQSGDIVEPEMVKKSLSTKRKTLVINENSMKHSQEIGGDKNLEGEPSGESSSRTKASSSSNQICDIQDKDLMVIKKPKTEKVEVPTIPVSSIIRAHRIEVQQLDLNKILGMIGRTQELTKVQKRRISASEKDRADVKRKFGKRDIPEKGKNKKETGKVATKRKPQSTVNRLIRNSLRRLKSRNGSTVREIRRDIMLKSKYASAVQPLQVLEALKVAKGRGTLKFQGGRYDLLVATPGAGRTTRFPGIKGKVFNRHSSMMIPKLPSIDRKIGSKFKCGVIEKKIKKEHDSQLKRKNKKSIGVSTKQQNNRLKKS